MAKKLQLIGKFPSVSGVDLPDVTESDDGKVLMVANGEWAAKELPKYDGSFSVTPSATDAQTLKTAQTYMDADVKIKKIPYAEVSNNAGGKTATIGNEV